MNSELERWQNFENFAQHNVDFVVAKDNYQRFKVLFSLRILTEFLLSAVFVYIGLNFLILSQFTLAIWPATGVALTLVFIRGYYPCLGVVVGAFCAYYINSHFLSFSAIQAIGFASYICLTRYLALKWIGAIQPLNKLSSLILFLILSLATTTAHVFFHQAIISYFDLSWHTSLQNTAIHVLSQFNGILCLTPLTLILDPFAPKTYFSFNKKNMSWWLICLGILIASIGFIISNNIIAPSIFLPAFILITCGFAYFYKQIPMTTLLLIFGVLYLGGIADFSLQLKDQPLLMASLLACIGSLGLIISSYKA